MSKINPRKIAIFTDVHALLEPLEAILEDIKKRGITEIYSLGDNIGNGPNPKEVLDKIKEYQITSLAGNAEDYVTLGIDPFLYYFNAERTANYLWTLSQITEEQERELASFPHSLELNLGGKRLGLCHFANDVRFDFYEKHVYNYRKKIAEGKRGIDEFLNTNSERQKEQIKDLINIFGKDDSSMKGYVSAYSEPLFNGQKIEDFAAIIEGHVHFQIMEEGHPLVYTLRAAGMGYNNDPVDSASYQILTEVKDGFELESILIPYDREKMEYSILNSSNPSQKIYDFTRLTRKR